MKKATLLPLCGLTLAGCATSPTSSSATTSVSSATGFSPSSSSSKSSSSKEEQKLPTIDYIRLYSPVDYNYVYIWNGNDHPLGEWPGVKMQSYDANWVTYGLENHKELTSFNVIFHNNSGSQSADLSVSGGPGHYFYLDGAVTKRDTLPGSDVDPGDYDLPDNASAYRNFYQLLVYSFADSNGDGIGDFKGIKGKLGYLKQLGIESIWLSPINKCTSYHAYDVVDYYAVNDKYVVDGYGLQNLIADAHKEGIQIVLDLVLNHTSSSCAWTREHPSWYGRDSKFGMPEFNFDNQELREEIKNVGRYWLGQGADGFRLDAAMWIYNGGTDQHTKNYAWWNEWCGAMREVKEDVYIIGEVLNVNHDLAYQYAQAGFNSTFDFEAMKHVYNATKNATYNYQDYTAKDLQKARKINPNYCLGRPLSNHDVGRFSDSHKDMEDAKAYYLSDEADLRLANALNVLTPGNTFVYYGDELGLKGTCPQGYDDMKARTPMPFGSQRTDSVKYFQSFKGDGVTTSVSLSDKTAEEDQANPASLYGLMSTLLKLKIAHPTIKSGEIGALSDLPSGLNGYSLTGAENIGIIYNSTSSSVAYDVNGEILYSPVEASGSRVNLPAKSILVYRG